MQLPDESKGAPRYAGRLGGFTSSELSVSMRIADACMQLSEVPVDLQDVDRGEKSVLNNYCS